MYKALVLITKGEGGRGLSETQLKVELADDKLDRLVGRVRKHLEIVEEETTPIGKADV